MTEYKPPDSGGRSWSVRPGDLRHLLHIERPVAAENENGVLIRDWVHVCTVWGAARDVSGREFFEAAAQQMENITTFTIRARAEIDGSMRVLFLDKPYEIIQINHMGYRGNYMQIKARHQGGEGT